MSDLISRLSELRCQYNCFDEHERDAYHTLSEAIKAISAQRTGRWIDDELMCKARCSVCGEEFSWMDNDMDRFWFCPNCGSYNGVEHE